MKTALIFGSSGLIGNHLLKLILKDNYYQKGDFVSIRESKPLSKMKRWIVINNTNNVNKEQPK